MLKLSINICAFVVHFLAPMLNLQSTIALHPASYILRAAYCILHTAYCIHIRPLCIRSASVLHSFAPALHTDMHISLYAHMQMFASACIRLRTCPAVLHPAYSMLHTVCSLAMRLMQLLVATIGGHIPPVVQQAPAA